MSLATQEAVAGESKFQDQPEQLMETTSQNSKVKSGLGL